MKCGARRENKNDLKEQYLPLGVRFLFFEWLFASPGLNTSDVLFRFAHILELFGLTFLKPL